MKLLSPKVEGSGHCLTSILHTIMNQKFLYTYFSILPFARGSTQQCSISQTLFVKRVSQRPRPLCAEERRGLGLNDVTQQSCHMQSKLSTEQPSYSRSDVDTHQLKELVALWRPDDAVGGEI